MSTLNLTPLPAGVKREALTEVLVDLARQLGPGARLPGVRELCNGLKVSTVTLDRVLLELDRRGVIQRHHGRGIFVSSAVKTNTVAFVFGGDVFSISPFWGLLLEWGKAFTADRGLAFRYYLDIPVSDKSVSTHGDLLGDLENGRVNALVLAACQGAEQVRWLQQWNLPMVVLDEQPPAKYSVVFDHDAFLKLAVEQLAVRGCQRVGFLGATNEDLCRHFADALTDAKIEYRRALHWEMSWYESLVPHKNFEQFAYSLLNRTFADTRPDGLVISDDTMARGAMMALLRQGIRPGRDVLIATAANLGSPVLTPYESDLILVDHDPQELVRQALDMIVILMQGKEPPQPIVRVSPKVRVKAA